MDQYVQAAAIADVNCRGSNGVTIVAVYVWKCVQCGADNVVSLNKAIDVDHGVIRCKACEEPYKGKG